MRVYVCEDSFEGILTGVYDAWASGLGHGNVRLELEGEYNLELFAEYKNVVAEEEKVKKVVRTLRNRISETVFEYVYKAAMSYEKGKADKIYRFIVLAIKNGAPVLQQLSNITVMDIFSMVRNVSNESHLLLGFIRFEELDNGVLFARISPKNHVLTIVAPHFSDRLSAESWVIYDTVHQMAAIHMKNKGWVLTKDVQLKDGMVKSEKESGYEELWKLFFHTIGIEARKNPDCQRNMLPLWYRENMTEFN